MYLHNLMAATVTDSQPLSLNTHQSLQQLIVTVTSGYLHCRTVPSTPDELNTIHAPQGDLHTNQQTRPNHPLNFTHQHGNSHTHQI
jgi:hypothetical protein